MSCTSSRRPKEALAKTATPRGVSGRQANDRWFRDDSMIAPLKSVSRMDGFVAMDLRLQSEPKPQC